MKIQGEWRKGNDGVERPFVLVRLGSRSGPTIERYFLVSTGADSTLLTRATFDDLGLGPMYLPLPGVSRPGGMGLPGTVRVVLDASLIDRVHPPEPIGGVFLAVFDPAELAENVLGRDILNGFHVVVSRLKGEVWVFAGAHDYQVTGP